MMDKKVYLNLFRFRGDTFAVQQDDGSYVRIPRPPTEDDLDKHFDGSQTMAMYPSMNNLCYLGCLDFDLPKSERNNKKAHEEMHEKITSCYSMFIDLGIESVLVEQTGGRGYHLWVFSDLVSSTMMAKLLRKVVDATLSEAEIFPLDGFGLGKAIRPPLGTHQVFKGVSKFVDPYTFEEIEITNEMAEDLFVNRITLETFESLNIPNVDKFSNSMGNNDFCYSSIPKVENFDEVFCEIRYCFQEIYLREIETTGGQGWSFMTAAAAEMLANGGTEEHVHEYFKIQDQYNRRETSKNLKPIMRKNLLPFRCTRLQELCPDYVLEFCPNCHTFKQHTLSENIDKAVDRSQGKEDRNEGDINDTLEQFSHIATDIEDLMSEQKYTMMINTFNSGKTWAAISFLKHTIHEKGNRVNIIVPTKKIKDSMMERMRKAEINFLDNPSNIEMCYRANTFKKLGYVPTMICKMCAHYTPIKNLIKPLKDDYIQSSDKAFCGDVEFFNKKAEEYSTCPKWVYLALLEATREENLAMLVSSSKLKYHFFIPDSPLIPAMSSSQTFCNIIDQIDFINRSIPKITFDDTIVFEKMRKLGILYIEDLEDAKVRIEDMLQNGEIDAKSLEEMEAVDYLTSWLSVQKMYDDGKLRRVKNAYSKTVYSYDYAGDRNLHFILNDVVGKKINPKLYDALINYIENIEIECAEGLPKVPKTFREVLEDLTHCNAVLGITSTPSDIECMNSHWLSKYMNCEKTILNNVFSIPNTVDAMSTMGIDEQTIIFSRKQEGSDYINDGLVRGYTQTGGEKDNVVIRSLQYPKFSESVMADLVQLCGGNIGNGVKVFYDSIINDAITQANKYNARKIFVPNPEIFSSLGFEIKIHDEISMEYWKEKIRERFNGSKFLYGYRLDTIPSDILESLIDSGFITMDGKKYIISEEL